jgi:hypothetical protein
VKAPSAGILAKRTCHQTCMQNSSAHVLSYKCNYVHVSTYCPHVVHILYTHIVHILYTQIAHILYTYCTHVLYTHIVHTYCTHIVHILYTHIAHILYTYCTHILSTYVHILYTYNVHIYCTYIYKYNFRIFTSPIVETLNPTPQDSRDPIRRHCVRHVCMCTVRQAFM